MAFGGQQGEDVGGLGPGGNLPVGAPNESMKAERSLASSAGTLNLSNRVQIALLANDADLGDGPDAPA